MQLYKSRGFSAFFQDTFTFIKQNGKHYFKHFFIVNGFFLLILMAIGYFISKFYTDIVFGGILQGNNATQIDEYMNENFGIFILLMIVFTIVALIAGLISYSYSAIYLKLYSENDGKNFETKDIVQVYKQNLGKLFIFLLCGIILGIPLIFVLGIGAFILVITIIGFLLLPFLVGAFSLFYNMTLMEYLQAKRGIWDSFGYAWNLMTKKFWAAVGSVGLFYLMAYVLQNVITMIPYLFFLGDMFTSAQQGDNLNPEEVGASLMVMMLVIFFITFIVGIILNNITQLNQGIVYYSLKEDNENINTKSVIDQIGSGE